MPRWIAVVAAVLVAAPALAGDSPRAEPAATPIFVGEYGSFTGPEAEFGRATDRGIQLAVDEVNAAGGIHGRPIAIKTFDDGGLIANVTDGVTGLITDGKVVALLGEVSSALSLAGGRVAQEYGVPMISPSSTHAEVTRLGDRVFRACFVDDFQGYAAAKFARSTLHLKRVAVLEDASQTYSTGLSDAFVRDFTAMHGKIAGEPTPYIGGDGDFAAPLGAIAADKPQAIFLPGYYPDVAAIVVQARKMGITAPFIGGDGWDSTELAKLAGPAIDGNYYVNHYANDDTHAAVKAFVASYQRAYPGESPDSLVALGYDAARLLFDAMRRAPSLDGKDLAAAIAATVDFPGVTGPIAFDAHRNPLKPAVIVQMNGGVPTYVTTILPPIAR